ncbi:MAG: DUF2934 domain-containing protein [Chitinivibrionales bacterium]
MDEIQKRIEQRAYEFFLERGRQPGHAMEDWMRAEKEIKAHKEPAAVQAASYQQENNVTTPFMKETKEQTKASLKQNLGGNKKAVKNFQNVR